VPTVVDAYRDKLPRFRAAIKAPAPIGILTEANSDATHASSYHQNVILEFAYAAARARGEASHLSVLDWGGGFGYLSFVLAELYPDLIVDYHVRDVPLVAESARSPVPGVTFWDNDECLTRRFDLVVASGSFQYFAEWKRGLMQLAGAARFLLLSRLPVTLDAPTFATRQRAYRTSYVGWVYNRDELVLGAEDAGLELVREFLEGFSCVIPNAPGNNEHRAFLFASRPSQ
jgi:putative methyltransferase (TIGR04325 family)